MIDNKQVLAVVPARGGSKGLRRKNIRDLGGRPLIAWTLDAAYGAALVDEVIVSSDDDEILGVAKEWGATKVTKRPSGLATDSSRTIEVLHHILENIEGAFDYVVQLQPTSPFRTSDDIDSAVRLCARRQSSACVSVCATEKSPYWMYSLSEEGRMAPLLGSAQGVSRRQDAETFYQLNGAIYVARVGWVRDRASFLADETVAYVMPRRRSIDIDTEDDLVHAQAMLEARQ